MEALRGGSPCRQVGFPAFARMRVDSVGIQLAYIATVAIVVFAAMEGAAQGVLRWRPTTADLIVVIAAVALASAFFPLIQGVS